MNSQLNFYFEQIVQILGLGDLFIYLFWGGLGDLDKILLTNFV